MAALNHQAALRAMCFAALAVACGWAREVPAKNTPDRQAPPGTSQSQNPPPAIQPKTPTPDETKTGVIRPPDVDPDMSKRVPNVDPNMSKPPEPQAPAAPEKPGKGRRQGEPGQKAEPR